MKYIPDGVTRMAFRAALHIKKQSPNLLFAGGIIGGVSSTVMACRATLKLADDLPTMKKALEQVKENTEGLSDSEQQRAVAIQYAANTVHVARLYGPSVLVGGVAIGLLTGSHVQLDRREKSAVAAYALLQKGYKEYRERVREEMGDEREGNIYRGVQFEKVKDEDGKSKKVATVDATKTNPYRRLFDEGSRDFTKSAAQNRIYIQCQENIANDLLQVRGHIFLNQVYEMLGLEHTKAGAVTGWVRTKPGDGHHGDGYIDFGMTNPENEPFLEGREPRVWLDFNVDGIILDLI